MVVLQCIVTFICSGTLLTGVADMIKRKRIEVSDVSAIMFLLLIIIAIWSI